jgi:DNA-binding CsgD family transcriptional regulator
MLARNELGHRLAILIALGDGRRAERLAASLSVAHDLVPMLAGELHDDDAVDVVIMDETAIGHIPSEVAPGVLLASGPVESRDRFAAILPTGTEPALIAAAARLAAAGYHIVAGARAAGAGKEEAHAPGVFGGDHDPAASDGAEPAPPSIHLSPREAEVLALLAEGAPNKVIARRLDISVHTAKFHVAAILVKLGAANRTDAIATAMRQGLVLA